MFSPHTSSPVTSPRLNKGPDPVVRPQKPLDLTPRRVQKQVVHTGITLTAEQKQTLIEGFQYDVAERIAKLKAHHQRAALALKSKIQARINRVSKRNWNKTIREFRAEVEEAKKRAAHIGRLMAQTKARAEARKDEPADVGSPEKVKLKVSGIPGLATSPLKNGKPQFVTPSKTTFVNNKTGGGGASPLPASSPTKATDKLRHDPRGSLATAASHKQELTHPENHHQNQQGMAHWARPASTRASARPLPEVKPRPASSMAYYQHHQAAPASASSSAPSPSTSSRPSSRLKRTTSLASISSVVSVSTAAKTKRPATDREAGGPGAARLRPKRGNE